MELKKCLNRLVKHARFGHWGFGTRKIPVRDQFAPTIEGINFLVFAGDKKSSNEAKRNSAMRKRIW